MPFLFSKDQCCRCGGFMVPDIFFDPRETVRSPQSVFHPMIRCLNCGNLEDLVIVQHRHPKRRELVLV